MFCSGCGIELDNKSNFCSSCGEKIVLNQTRSTTAEKKDIENNMQQNLENFNPNQNDLAFIGQKKIITVKPIKKSKDVIEIRFLSMGFPSLYGRVLFNDNTQQVEYCLYEDESQVKLILKIKSKDKYWIENEVFDSKENYLGRIIEKSSGKGLFNPIYKLQIITKDDTDILVKEKGGIVHFTLKWIRQVLFGNGFDILTIFFSFLVPRKGSVDFFFNDINKIVSIERKGSLTNVSWDYYILRDLKKMENILDPRLVLAVQSLMSFGKGK